MERLVAWYRVGSSNGAVVALVVANLVPLAGVLFLGWSAWQILVIYWLENGVVGGFNVLKMMKAEGPGDDRAIARMTIDGRSPGGGSSAAFIRFFCMHYGIFWFAHGVIVFSLLPLFNAMAPDGGSSVPTTPDPLGLGLAVVALVISHGLSYRLNFIGGGEYKRVSPEGQMYKPYGRLMVLHVTLIFGAFAIALTGASVAAVAILVLLKIALDIGLHLAEHRDIYIPMAKDGAGAD
jgi:hypothetical protein